MSLRKLDRWGRLGVRAQLVLLFLLVFGGIFTAFSFGTYHYIASTHRYDFDTALYNYVIGVADSLDSQQLHASTPLERQTFSPEMILPFPHGATLLKVSDSKGRPLVRSKSLVNRSLPRPQVSAETLHREKAIYEDVSLKEEGDDRNLGVRYRMVSHEFKDAAGDHYLIQAAVPLLLLDRHLESVLAFFALSVPIILVLAGLSALGFSRRAMAPVSAITAKANAIEAQNLSERIPVPESNDEIRELAITLNVLLDRLERAFRSQEEFISDASHQIKTPLSILKGELEIFRKGSRSIEELNAFLDSAESEIRYLSRMTEDLLTLARIGNEGAHRTGEKFRLDEKLMESVARLSRIAEKRHVRLNVELKASQEAEADSFEFFGEPELIRSLIDNIVDNAIKYSPENEVVKVSLRELDHSFVLTVSDRGKGIAPAALPHVFNRFFRTDDSHSGAPGTGLGLPLVKRIAELHSGFVLAENSPSGGAHFTVSLAKA